MTNQGAAFALALSATVDCCLKATGPVSALASTRLLRRMLSRRPWSRSEKKGKMGSQDEYSPQAPGQPSSFLPHSPENDPSEGDFRLNPAWGTPTTPLFAGGGEARTSSPLPPFFEQKETREEYLFTTAEPSAEFESGLEQLGVRGFEDV